MAEVGVFRFEADGTRYELAIDDITVEEARAFRMATGITLMQAMLGGLDLLETIAGCKWLLERRENPKLTYAQASKGLTYGNIRRVEDDEPVAEDVEVHPPGDGAKSAPPSPPSQTSSESDRGKSTSLQPVS